MDDIFKRAHEFVAQWEGGLDDDPRDPGGITKYGVCLSFLKDFYKRRASFLGAIGILGPVTRETIKSLTKQQAENIFYEEFWSGNHCKEIASTSPRLAMVLYDTSVNMGSDAAAKLLQRAVGAKEDGVIGPKTLAAVRDSGDFMAAAAMLEFRKNRYLQIVDARPASKCFLKGWLNRCNALAVEVSK